MNDNFDFEIVESTRGELDVPDSQSGGQRFAHALADNMGRILDLAGSIVEIERIGAQTDAYVKKLQADREMLAQETENYVKRLQAETHSKVSKVEAIADMMDKYNKAENPNLSSDQFFKLVDKIFDDGRLFNNE